MLEKVIPCVCCNDVNERRSLDEAVEKEKPFKCEVCGISFNEENELVEHSHLHDLEYNGKVCGSQCNTECYQQNHINSTLKKHACHQCDKVYKTKRGLEGHILFHHKRFICSSCDKSFVCREDLESHVKTIEGEVYFCGICDEKFACEGVFRSHVLRHIREKVCRCKVCGVTFINQRYLQSHQKLSKCHEPIDQYIVVQKSHVSANDPTFSDSSGEQTLKLPPIILKRKQKSMHKCVVCWKRFSTKVDLKYHSQSHRKSIIRYRCKICRRIFSSPVALIGHQRNSHMEKTNECPYCNKKVFSKNGLKGHIFKMHLKYMKNPVCSVCDRTLHSENQLREHMKSHYGKKKKAKPPGTGNHFECEFCHKRVATQIGLKRHRTTVHCVVDIEEHTCEICEKVFDAKKDLKNHQLLHSSDPVYACDYCNMLYKSCTMLDTHMQRNHDTSVFDTLAFIPL